MKNSSIIADSVFKVNLKYVQLQNKTKELFFRCLDEGRDLEYFKAKLEELWEGVNYSYIQDDLTEYEAYLHEINTKGKIVIEPSEPDGSLFALVPASVILAVNDKFQRVKTREYKNSLNSYAYKTDKQEYLKLKVESYTNQIVPYKVYRYVNGVKTDEVIGYRFVQPSTYNSMIHNTNLTRQGWNTTLKDGDSIGATMYYIPYHNFSCPHCLEHQNKPMTKEQVIDLIGYAEEAEGDILHPNCKCMLTIYNNTVIPKLPYSTEEIEEQYHIRQKVNTLTLRKEEVLTDRKIQRDLRNQDKVDKLNQKISRINEEIRNLKSALPTEELKRQVVAINR